MEDFSDVSEKEYGDREYVSETSGKWCVVINYLLLTNYQLIFRQTAPNGIKQ